MRDKMQTKQINHAETHDSFHYQMCILSVIGICFVLLGHLRNDLSASGTFYGWFPYYSFHMPLFLFVSGYFFRQPEKDLFFKSFGRFLWKKLKSLILPFYVINGLFILFDFLIAGFGFSRINYTIKDYLLMPLAETQPTTFSFATWFLPALFLAEVYYYLLRAVLDRLFKDTLLKEVLFLILILAMSSAAFYIRSVYEPGVTVVVLLRSVVMLFFLQVGFLYRHYLERLNTLPGVWYFLILGIVQFLLILYSRNSRLSPGLFDLSSFGKIGFLYYCCGTTGILLWLRISRLIASIPHKSRLLVFTGKNTKYIMSFHIFGFFLLNCLFYLIYSLGTPAAFLTDFDRARFFDDLFFYRCSQDNPRVLVLYFLAGMAVSLGLAKLIDLGKSRIRRFGKNRRNDHA